MESYKWHIPTLLWAPLSISAILEHNSILTELRGLENRKFHVLYMSVIKQGAYNCAPSFLQKPWTPSFLQNLCTPGPNHWYFHSYPRMSKSAIVGFWFPCPASPCMVQDSTQWSESYLLAPQNCHRFFLLASALSLWASGLKWCFHFLPPRKPQGRQLLHLASLMSTSPTIVTSPSPCLRGGRLIIFADAYHVFPSLWLSISIGL